MPASGYTGLADMFSLAGRAISAARKEPSPFDIMTASPDGQPVTDGSGRLLTADAALADIKSCDAVLIPGLYPMHQTRRHSSVTGQHSVMDTATVRAWCRWLWLVQRSVYAGRGGAAQRQKMYDNLVAVR
jgi:transcriptional regulator GlxA family with amidase domain